MKRALQQIVLAVVSVLPARAVFALLERLAPPLLRRGSRYAPALVYAAARKYHDGARHRGGPDGLPLFKVPLGYKMYIPVTDNHLPHRRFGVYHPRALLQTIERLCPPGARVCEIGTHLGEMTLYVAKLVGKEGAVYAFEIDGTYRRILQQSLDANGFRHVRLEHKAVGVPGVISVGDGYGDVVTTMDNFPELNVASSLGTEFFTEPPERWNKAEIRQPALVAVERVDLYDYFTRLDCRIDTFFMDIEGCEVYAIPMILRLARRYRYRPNIVFEVHHNAYSGEQARLLRQSLLDAGYRMTSPDDRHVVCE